MILALLVIRGDSIARVIIYISIRDTIEEIVTALNVDIYFSNSGTVNEKAVVLTR